MAAFVRHGLSKRIHYLTAQHCPQLGRPYATRPRKPTKPNPDRKRAPRIDSTADSLAEKGYLRAQNAYNPPQDVAARFKSICETICGNNTKITDTNQRFALLNACSKEFNHSVPNSLLHTMEDTEDVLKFYKTHVNTTVPLDMMKNMELPENLHILYEYNRFHPETDTMFNGVTAFPRSSTLVTGLTTRKKYRGFEARTTWPYNT